MEKKPKCNICQDSGWVCEEHSTLPFKHHTNTTFFPFGVKNYTCVGAGMPCQCNTYNSPWNYPDETRSEIKNEKS